MRSADVFEVYSRVYGATAESKIGHAHCDVQWAALPPSGGPLRGGVSIDSVVRARGAFGKVGSWRREPALQPRSAVPGVVSIFSL